MSDEQMNWCGTACIMNCRLTKARTICPSSYPWTLANCFSHRVAAKVPIPPNSHVRFRVMVTAWMECRHFK